MVHCNHVKRENKEHIKNPARNHQYDKKNKKMLFICNTIAPTTKGP